VPLGIEPALLRALLADVEAAPALGPTEVRRPIEIFARGAQTMEAALYARDTFLRSPEARLERLATEPLRLLERRVLARKSWRSAARPRVIPTCRRRCELCGPRCDVARAMKEG
jgi:hypothetical protein